MDHPDDYNLWEDCKFYFKPDKTSNDVWCCNIKNGSWYMATVEMYTLEEKHKDFEEQVGARFGWVLLDKKPKLTDLELFPKVSEYGINHLLYRKIQPDVYWKCVPERYYIFPTDKELG